MNIEELRTSGIRLHGNGLMARVQLRSSPKAWCPQESAIRHRWYGMQPITPAADGNSSLTDVQVERKWC